MVDFVIARYGISPDNQRVTAMQSNTFLSKQDNNKGSDVAAPGLMNRLLLRHCR